MVRPAFALALLVAAFAVDAPGARAATELPGRMGLYPTSQATSLAMLDSKIAVRVRGPIAEAVITQTFKNDTDKVTEATYVFPLPADAAVTAMEIESGNRTIRASIESRDQAQQRYERAVAAGVGAGLLDQERPDVFTQTVSAIPAKGTVTVTLRFDTVAQYRGGTWELVLPMVVAPRYVPGTASGRSTTGSGRSPDTDRSPDASRITPAGAPGAGGKTEVTLELSEVDDVTSPTHELGKTKSGYTFTDAKSDHDAIVRWKAKAPSAGWMESDDGGGYAAVVVEAPAATARTTAVKMMLVLDRAATTRGDADAVKKPLLRALLSGLAGKDRAAVTGSDKLDWRTGDQILRALEESGKPSTAFDLTKVLTGLRADGSLLLVTDGLVADDRAALQAAIKVGVPIHVIGIGPAPNRSLLSGIAAQTGGTIRFATVGDDVNAIARDVLADLANPPAALSINWGTLAASDVVPSTLPRLGVGQATIVLARIKRVQSANARVRGDVFGFVSVATPKTPDGATSARGTLGRRWAKLKLDELVAGGSAKAISEHALRFGLVSPLTSMVAIGNEVIIEGGVKHSKPVPVSVPEGMQWQQVKKQTSVDTLTLGSAKQEAKPDVDKKNREEEDKFAAKKKKPKDAEIDSRSVGEGAGDEEEPDGESPRGGGMAPPSPVAMDSSGADYEDDGEQELSITRSERRRKVRFGVGFGAGLAVVNGDAAPMFSLSTRVEAGLRNAPGLEGSLWLVDGLHPQGSLFGTFTRHRLGDGSFTRKLDLGFGLGLRLTGEAAGPAANLTLRTKLPLRGLATFLRYDGALLLHDGVRDGQNAGSFGFEAAF